jgi:hypothetical protein
MEQAEALAQYRKLVRDNPSEKDGARKSFYDHFQIDPEGFSRPKQTDFQRTAARNKADIGAEQTKADFKQDVSNAKGKFWGEMAASVPVILAAPLTAGTSLAAGAAIMGGAAAAGGIAREGTKGAIGSDQIPMDANSVAKTLGWDAVLGAAGEGVGRGIGLVTKNLLPKLIERSAAKSEKGQQLLKETYEKGKTALFDMIQEQPAGRVGRPTINGKPAVNMELPITDLITGLKKPPQGIGPLVGKYTGPTPRAQELIREAEGQLETRGGTVGSHQPLDVVLDFKGRVNEVAWKKGEDALPTIEGNVLKRFVGQVDDIARKELGKVGGPGAVQHYNGLLQLEKTQKANDLAVSLTESVAKKMMYRMGSGALAGGVAGGTYGYTRGGVGGIATGAVEGAAVGAGVTAAAQLPPKASTWILEVLANHPQAAPMMKKAVDFWATGQAGKAEALAARAFGMSGVREIIKDQFRDESPTMGSVVNQNQEGRTP